MHRYHPTHSRKSKNETLQIKSWAKPLSEKQEELSSPSIRSRRPRGFLFSDLCLFKSHGEPTFNISETQRHVCSPVWQREKTLCFVVLSKTSLALWRLTLAHSQAIWRYHWKPITIMLSASRKEIEARGRYPCSKKNQWFLNTGIGRKQAKSDMPPSEHG